ncbi:MAG: hypothetical protein J6D79_03505, partial [Clostridia bacterium]|nr:hypothetical protein [Clostridia bacterium]
YSLTTYLNDITYEGLQLPTDIYLSLLNRPVTMYYQRSAVVINRYNAIKYLFFYHYTTILLFVNSFLKKN